MKQRLVAYIFSIFCLFLVLGPGARIEAASSPLTEEQVKAAYIYNFAKFVQWPETAFLSADEPLRICVAGSEELFEVMEPLADKTVQGHPLKISQRSSLSASSDCHILFIGREYRKTSWKELEKRVFTQTLTIADFDSFAADGGIIEFVHEGARIRFGVNNAAAKQAGLKLSSKILKLAVFVEE